MPKPDPERAELSKQWRIFLQGIEEDFENIPATWMRMFCPEILDTGESREKGEMNKDGISQTQHN